MDAAGVWVVIPFLASKAIRRAALWGAALALIVGAAWWLRADAKSDVRAEIEANGKDARIDALTEGDKRHEEVKDLAADDLRDALYGRLREANGPQ